MTDHFDFYQILKSLKIIIKDKKLYQTAFTHRSYLNEVSQTVESNERLEFLGDAVLSLVISSYLYQRRTQDKEGELTNLRAYIVRTESLAKAAQKLSLGTLLRLSKGEEMSAGRENPQILANTYEASLGAVYLDWGLEKAREYVYQTLLPFFEQEIEEGAPPDPKSKLQEFSQSKFQVSPKYKILESSGPDHAKKFTVGVYLEHKQVGSGTGLSKQQAEEEAAKEALRRLTGKGV